MGDHHLEHAPVQGDVPADGGVPRVPQSEPLPRLHLQLPEEVPHRRPPGLLQVPEHSHATLGQAVLAHGGVFRGGRRRRSLRRVAANTPCARVSLDPCLSTLWIALCCSATTPCAPCVTFYTVLCWSVMVRSSGGGSLLASATPALAPSRLGGSVEGSGLFHRLDARVDRVDSALKLRPALRRHHHRGLPAAHPGAPKVPVRNRGYQGQQDKDGSPRCRAPPRLALPGLGR
mmetsp:Transcript_36263/g.114430  ORF Transcript_36263/g.114430 Transcript_36263/m.114430 type:complete len:231 (-) Transcript_36263:198-890(-)